MWNFSQQLDPKVGVFFIQLVVLIIWIWLNTFSKKSKDFHKCPKLYFRRVNPNIKGKDDWSPLEIAT